MKKTIIFWVLMLCGIATTTAQDIIIKTDASQIEAKVTEITPAEVRYKRFSNPDGPTYMLPVGDIGYIQYANGEKEYFAAQIAATPLVPATPVASDVPATPVASDVPATPLVPATPVASDVPAAPAKIVSRTYEIGEFYSEGGVTGVVCSLTQDAQHGLVISMDEIYLPWSIFRKPDFQLTGANISKDGSENMCIIERYIADKGLTWDDFPAFKWCREKGEGWYLPAIDEMLQIGNGYNGTRIQSSRQKRLHFNNSLKDNGGKRMDRMVYYFTSTEMDDKSAYTTHMAPEPPYVVDIPKSNKFLVRAVHKF